MTPIVEKLKKLIAHEQSARTIGNTAEAESFASKIQEMLWRHKLSMSEVDAEIEDRTNPISAAAATIHKTRAERWVVILTAGVAHCFYCKHLFRDGYRREKAQVVFVGRESDREAAVSLFNYLFALGLELITAKLRRLRAEPTVLRKVEEMRDKGFSDATKVFSKITQKYKDDFLLGYAAALCRRLINNKQDLEDAAAPNATAMIVRDSRAIEEYCRARFEISEQKPRASRAVNSAAFADGYRAGEDADITTKAAIGAG